MSDLTLKIILIISGIAYLTYLYFFDCRTIHDERRELIRLKSLRLTQKVTLGIMIVEQKGDKVTYRGGIQGMNRDNWVKARLTSGTYQL